MRRRRVARARRHDHQYYLGLVLVVAVYISLALLFRNDEVEQGAPDRHRRQLKKGAKPDDDDNDFSNYSCDDFFQHADPQSQCAYAQTCNGGDGIVALTLVYCSQQYSPRTLLLAYTPALALFLIILFRVLGSTAEEFFSPGLELFSLKLGLPERFAGVTLLALGNGAPDVASTVNAIRNDRKRGYLLALGELTGAAMVASTVIVGAVAFISPKPVPCRAAFVRDVVMFIITMALVFGAFHDGSITPREIWSFVGLYLAYVLIVLLADVNHIHQRAREEAESEETSAGIESDDEKHRRPSETTALKAAVAGKKNITMSIGSYELSHNENKKKREFWKFSSFNSSEQPHAPSIMQRMMGALSNYGDEIPEEAGEEEEEPIISVAEQQQGSLHGGQGSQHDRAASAGWGERDENGAEPLMVFHPHHGGIVNVKQHTIRASIGISREEERHWLDIRQELSDHFKTVWDETYGSDEFNLFDKVLFTCELPFTILRLFSIPVPCEGYYCRPLLALSVALSPFWLCYYVNDQFDSSIVDQPWLVVVVVFAVPLLAGLLVLRCAPRGDVPPRPLAAVPLTLIGFVVSATWLDLIADHLVSLMTFFGIICRIPSSIMGLTVLAWGNSSQDLVANMTVARKDLATMAITASFAGPVFNILIGLGLGFALLDLARPGKLISVHLDNPLRVGFLFSVLNGVLMIVSGVCFGKGWIPKRYGYVALAVYCVYALISITI